MLQEITQERLQVLRQILDTCSEVMRSWRAVILEYSFLRMTNKFQLMETQIDW